jgi:hypothetical protein
MTVVVKIDDKDRATTVVDESGAATVTFSVDLVEWLISRMQIFYRSDGVDGDPLGSDTDTPLYWDLEH